MKSTTMTKQPAPSTAATGHAGRPHSGASGKGNHFAETMAAMLSSPQSSRLRRKSADTCDNLKVLHTAELSHLLSRNRLGALPRNAPASSPMPISELTAGSRSGPATKPSPSPSPSPRGGPSSSLSLRRRTHPHAVNQSDTTSPGPVFTSGEVGTLHIVRDISRTPPRETASEVRPAKRSVPGGVSHAKDFALVSTSLAVPSANEKERSPRPVRATSVTERVLGTPVGASSRTSDIPLAAVPVTLKGILKRRNLDTGRSPTQEGGRPYSRPRSSTPAEPSQPSLIPTMKLQEPFSMTLVDARRTGESEKRRRDDRGKTSGVSPTKLCRSNGPPSASTPSPPSRKGSAASSELTNDSPALGTSGSTAASLLVWRKTLLIDEETAGEATSVVSVVGAPEGDSAVRHAAPTSATGAAGTPEMLRSATPVRKAPRTPRTVLAAAPSATATTSSTSLPASKKTKKTTMAEDVVVDVVGEGTAAGATTATAAEKKKAEVNLDGVAGAVLTRGTPAELSSPSPRPVVQVRKVRGPAASENDRNSPLPSPLRPSLGTPVRPSGASPSSPGKATQTTPTRVASGVAPGPQSVDRGGTPHLVSGSIPSVAGTSPTPANASVSPSRPRAAAMLTQTLSVVRPMAPVVHVRIRPVLPSVGESRHRRRVYFLDHENVMVTRANPVVAPNTSDTTLVPPLSLAESMNARWSGADVHTQPPLPSLKGDGTGLISATVLPGGKSSNTGGTGGTSSKPPVCIGEETTAATLYSTNMTRLCSLPGKELRSSPRLSAATPAAAPRESDHATGSHRVSTGTASSISERFYPATSETPLPPTAHHNRTISWQSIGSEDPYPSSRLSGGSMCVFTSPHQAGLSFTGGAATSMQETFFTPQTQPALTTFKPFTEDVALSPATTPRGGSAGGGAAGTPRAGGGNSRAPRSSRRGAAAQQRGMARGMKTHSSAVSLSTMPAFHSRTATRRNSMDSDVGNPSSTHHPALFSPASGRRHQSGSGLGASVSVSALSMSVLPKSVGAANVPTDNGQMEAQGGSRGAATGLPPHRAAPQPLQRQHTSLGSFVSGAEQHFSFEFVHDEEATQADVFEESVLRFADEALLAQNVAIICYGPTGSGKTYSMMGSQASSSSSAHPTPGPTTGTTPRAGSERAQQPSQHRSSVAGPAAGPSSTQRRASRAPASHGRGVGVGDTRRRLIDEPAEAVSGSGAGCEKNNRAAEEDEMDGASWPQLDSRWQYGYTGGRMPTDDDREGDGNDRGGAAAISSSISAAFDPAGTGGGISEIGILPRLVHTLLERRGEAIMIRRELGRDDGDRNGSSPQSAVRPESTAKRIGALSLTLRDLTFYGIELYMDELCDLLDPGKRPIQTVSDTGGLVALCQRINEARDYRISGSRGGASHGKTQTARMGGGMPITSLADLRRAYRLAHGNRVTARHARNDTSSRSHAIFLLQLDFDLSESTDVPNNDISGGTPTGGATASPLELIQRVYSYVAMVDLAGCERVKQTKVEGIAFREAQYINRSLSALSSVVLSLHHRATHIPYRDSKLTRLLRPCLEGGRVLTLVHVAPCSSTEAVNTLKFADQIRHTHIPTHALAPTTARHRELLSVFADLIDPMQGLWEAQVRQGRQQLHRLCADVRLSFFARAVGVLTHRSSPAASDRSDVVSELSSASEADDSISLSPGDTSFIEGLPPLRDGATAKEKRRTALRLAMHEIMGPIHAQQREAWREATRIIRQHKEHRISANAQRIQQHIEEAQATIQQLTQANARLAKESSNPLPRDPHALEVTRRIRESNEELGAFAKEEATLTALATALRQRLAAQDDLEAAVDEQLRKVQQRTAQAMRTLSAAVAVHPPGGALSASDAASPIEPTLPTGFTTTTALVMDTNADPELRDIAHQQLSLAKELAALRLETACFEIGTGLWEGLWARAMRKEIITALEVEAFAMERILLEPRALSMMMMDDRGGGAGSGDGKEDKGEETSPPGLPHPRLPSGVADDIRSSIQMECDRVNLSDATGHLATTPVMSSAAADAQQLAAPSSTPPVSSVRGLLWHRLGKCRNRMEKSGAEVKGALEVSQEGLEGLVERETAPFGESPLPKGQQRDIAVESGSVLASSRCAAAVLEPAASIAASNEGAPNRGGVAVPFVSGSMMAACAAAARTQRLAPEDSVPNPLLLLSMEEPNLRLPSPLLPFSSNKNDAGIAVAAALTPMTLAGFYGEEQAMQEAALELLLREGIVCEVCCLGESSRHVLHHFMLPNTADAPMAHEIEAEDATAAPLGSVSGAQAHYYVPATAIEVPSPTAATGGATVSFRGTEKDKKESTAKQASQRGADQTSASRLPTGASQERGDEAKPACCTTRQGRLRLVHMPRRPHHYILEFVYSHHGIPVAPRMQAALLDQSEDTFLLPRKTNLEQMVDALPSVHGTAGRGGGTTRPQGSLREHRLFSIPLYEPTLHLHLDVLEEGIPDMTTPVPATVIPTAAAFGSDGGDIGEGLSKGAIYEEAGSHVSAPVPSMCVARRREAGSQLVLEVRGVPRTAALRRPQLAPLVKTKTPRANGRQPQQPALKKSMKNTNASVKPDRQGSPSQQPSISKPSHLSASPSSTSASLAAPSRASTAAWNDIVLAKRLSCGGELVLPSSCIFANTGCCSLVLRFLGPLCTSPTSRVEGVEAVVGALCGILRPPVSEMEGRRYSSLSSPHSKVGGAPSQRRSSVSVRPVAAGGNGHGGARPRGSASRSPLATAHPPETLEVVSYTHVPNVMFTGVSAATPFLTPREGSCSDRGSRGEREASSMGHPRVATCTTTSTGAPTQALSLPQRELLDDLEAVDRGLLGQPLQSSCSAAHTFSLARVTPPSAILPAQPSLSTRSVDRSLRRSLSSTTMITATVGPSLIDAKGAGATLRVQFHWVSTPADLTPLRGEVSRKTSGNGRSGVNLRTNAANTTANNPVDRDGAETATEVQGEGAVPPVAAPKKMFDEAVRGQMRSALSILANLSFVFADGRSLRDAASDLRDRTVSLSLVSTPTELSNTSDLTRSGMPVRREQQQEKEEAGELRFANAMAVASLLRQLDTYRHRVRQLFRQQLYDAEDINGNDIAPPAPLSWHTGEWVRGAYLREVQEEVRQTVGLPYATALGGGSAASPFLMPSNGASGYGERGALPTSLEPGSGGTAPNTQVTLPDAREACATAVPWSVWQWAYRWSRLRQLLRGDIVNHPTSPLQQQEGSARPVVSRAEAAAAWLPLVARDGGTTLSISTSLGARALSSAALSPAFSATSSSSDEGYVMEGGWLSEARLVSRSKRVWLTDVPAKDVPSYLESCAAAGLP